MSSREASRSETRIRAAGFPARKTIEEFTFTTGLGAKLAEAGNIVLLGPPGTGKTHLAIALGMKAAGQGHRVLFATAAEWMQRLQTAHHLGRLPAELAKLRRCGLPTRVLPLRSASLILTSDLAFSRRWGLAVTCTIGPEQSPLWCTTPFSRWQGRRRGPEFNQRGVLAITLPITQCL